MDAIRQLLKDHEEVEKFYHQWVLAGEEAFEKKKSIAMEVIEEITHHVEKEEKVLFPAFVEKGGEEAEEMVNHGLEEHRITEFIMARLKTTNAKDKSFDAKFSALMESTKHHYEFEETEVFPKAKKALEGELKRLGEKMDALKEKRKK
jgi:hemerythrin-like domain-containing protein